MTETIAKLRERIAAQAAKVDKHEKERHRMLRLGAQIGPTNEKLIDEAAKAMAGIRYVDGALTNMNTKPWRHATVPPGCVAIQANDLLGLYAEIAMLRAERERHELRMLEDVAAKIGAA